MFLEGAEEFAEEKMIVSTISRLLVFVLLLFLLLLLLYVLCCWVCHFDVFSMISLDFQMIFNDLRLFFPMFLNDYH